MNLHSRYLLWQPKRWEVVTLMILCWILITIAVHDQIEINQLHKELHEDKINQTHR